MKKKIVVFIIGLLLNLNTSIAQQIQNFTPKEIVGGKGDIITISGSGFGAIRGSSYISFFLEGEKYTNAAESATFKYVKWSDTEIKMEMPVAFSNRIKMVKGTNEVFSVEMLKVMANLAYREVNPLVYNLLIDKNNRGGITWYVHPTYWNNAEIKQAIADVVKEFRCKTGVNYVIEPLTKTIPLSLDQGLHIIAPDENLNIVGYNAKLWSSCILGAETFYFNETQLLQFDTDQKWYYGVGKAPVGTTKFRYVLYHEMGHSLGLGHVNEEGQSMYPTVNFLPSDNWSQRDTITTAEKTAIQHYVTLSQNFSFTGCGINPISTIDNCENVYGQNVRLSEYINPDNSLIYPNPASNYFTIQVPRNTTIVNAQLRIFDHFGKLCIDKYINYADNIELPETLKNGFYNVFLTTESQVFSSKLLILKSR